MSELTPSQFAGYFQHVHDHAPFPWQLRLTEQVLSRSRWPDVIDLPTGTGKTAVLDTAVFALAAKPEVFPRRVVFVIDRRIVVDQVYERARRIEEAIRRGTTPTLRLLRERITTLSEGSLLGVVALRGGIPIDAEWARRPDEPWTMVSTVDQFGSRLLFRGYGVGRGMRPIHAGLAGSDCLVILDEVHLSRAFADTVRAVAKVDSDSPKRLDRRFHVVEMSATPDHDAGWKFSLEESDLAESNELRQRVSARKSATLMDAGAGQPHQAIPAAVKRILKSELDEGVRSVGVIVNRVRTARETHSALLEAGLDSHLVTGRMRPLDRQRRVAHISNLVDPDRPLSDDSLSVVVATQAIEVGADYSFDALITEVAPIDSLRQRFGRLDRRGSLAHRTGGPAKAWIVGTRSVLNARKPDPIYGDAVRVTWVDLQQLAEGEGVVDFSPRPAAPMKFSEGSTAPKTQAPLLLPSYLDSWIQTDPEPTVQPGIEWFLHGMDSQQVADVTVIWRFDRSPEALRAVPLRPAEHLQVPVGAARAWLSGGPEEPVADAGVLVGESAGDEGEVQAGWVRWQGHGERAERILPNEIRPGDVLVVDPGLGGLSDDNWDPGAVEPVRDLGDEAQHAFGQRYTLRLNPRLVDSHGLPTAPAPSDASEAEASLRDRVDEWLSKLEEMPDLLPWLKDVAERLMEGYRIDTMRRGSVSGNALETGVSGQHGEYYVLESKRLDPSAMDGSDESVSFTGTGVTLRDHLSGVGERVADYARRLGLSTELQEDLRLAAQLHDLGKVDSRFQSQMVGGDPVARAMLDEPLAKSLPDTSVHRGGWPPVRHEIMSVALAQSNAEVLELANDADLVLHLVETHHGHARPLPPINEDPNPELLEFDHAGLPLSASTDVADSPLALEMADRFWRLNRRYGRYGLAWLEAILRLADHQQSAKEAGK